MAESSTMCTIVLLILIEQFIMTNSTLPFAHLEPNDLLDAIERIGIACDGRLLQLNSFENRVYQIGLADGGQYIAKFYRPERWSDDAILEEHHFTLQLAEQEVHVVPPLIIQNQTLHHDEHFRFALFEKQVGRTPELDREDTLEWLGRFIGRIHAMGAVESYHARPALDVHTFGQEPRDFIVAGDWLPMELRTTWISVADQALDCIRLAYERTGHVQSIRLHGDCHPGNLFWTNDDGPYFVDFDDSRSGPAIQDLWMLLSGSESDMKLQMNAILRGYEMFKEFDDNELKLIEALRTLRLIHYSAWIARRWEDPAFPIAFPDFGTVRYWQDRILELREQIALMQSA